jgi:phenylpyruvate tautomerase PptA (4-oxalocrotonate tautomerase family)
MPLWRIYHESSVFTDAQKVALAKSITKLYNDIGLPAFYTNVIFVPVPAASIYVGGVPATKFVRFTIEQIARSFKNDEVKAIWLNKIDAALAPHLKERGDLTWEYHIVETERQLWKVNGIVPPGIGTLAEKRWKRDNRASEYAEDENVKSKL